MIEALDEIDLTISENQWNGIESRTHDRIAVAAGFPSGRALSRLRFAPSGRALSRSRFVDRRKTGDHTRSQQWRAPLRWAQFTAAAALLLITIGLSRLATPTTEPQKSPDNAQAIYVEHTVPLDPVTVDFLEESELLLRNVMKMTPHDTDDLADAKKVASEQLAELDQRKEAAVDIPPVVSVMETYETILRDLRNVDERSADEDMGDIRKRIQQNGLIASMKAFQPRVTEVSFSLR